MWLELLHKSRGRRIDGIPVYYKAKIPKTVVVNAYRPDADIIAIGSTASKKLPKEITHIPRYPVFIDTTHLLMTPIQIKNIGGLVDGEDVPTLLWKIANVYGIIINCSKGSAFAHQRPVLRRSGVDDQSFFDLPYVSKCDTDVWHVPKNIFGWFGDQNKELLTTIIHKQKPRIIVELGTWLGRSAKHIRKEADPKTALICFDHFRSPFLSVYGNQYHPIDRFYHGYMRFETFHRNLYTEKTHNTYSVRYNCNDAVALLKKHGIEVSLFYIDFQKSSEPLRALLESISKSFPRATVIGDDVVFRSVRIVVQSLRDAQLFESCYVMNTSVSALGTPKSDKKRQIMNKAIKTLDCMQADCKKYRYEVAVQVLQKRPPEDFLAFIKKHRLRMNVPVKRLHMANTLWHVFYTVMREKRPQLVKYEGSLMKYEAVDPKVRNLCCLTAPDIKKYPIVLT